MKKILSIIALLVLTSNVVAQDLNDYKYALVPSKFSFSREKDEYRLNTLSKMFMQKYGFESYLDSDILPSDFASDNCNKVYVDVVEDNSMMITKVKVVLKDCYNQVLFTSDEGKSKLKDYTAAYNQALREAFASFEKLNHQYNGNGVTPKKEPQVETKVEVKVTNSVTSNVETTLFAQPINNGFQIINAEPKVLYKIYKTSTKDFFIATKGTTQGVFFSRNNEWFFEYYQNDKLVSEKVEVKF
ncbi:hypothetical protein [Flavobacterium sp.]|jgi:hypothetical protein|uniref:hypothetical protein n=1 Tax=Flavobacterium sp. TaxID=239 RepID=UPI0037BEC8AC